MTSKKQHGGDAKANGSVKTSNKKYIDTIDPDDPEYIRELQRPAEIKEDVRQMVDRHRVKQILQSRTFREELDDIINDQMKTGPNATHLQALQQISDLLLPQGRALGVLNVGPVIPISDIRGVDSLNYSKTEKVLRCKLATLYRLFDLYGWANGFQCSVSARVSADSDHYLVAPFGMLFREITAASLVRVDASGKVLDPGVTTLGINQLDFQLHSAIYAARPDILCVVHLRHPIAVAVSVLSCGLLPLCPEAMELGEVSVSDYAGYVDDKGEANTIARALGPQNKAMVLKNCGVLVCGESVEEAYYNADNTVTACDTQLRTLPIGLENISLPSDEVRRKVYEASNTQNGRRVRGKGTMEFEALMRQLDNAGYRTGYAFVESVQEARKRRAASDMAISTSAAADADNRASSPHKPLSLRKHLLDWSQSPTIYHKEGDDEAAAKSPRWVSEGSTGKTTPKIKEYNANAYAPLGPNTNELKEKFKQIRQEYYTDKKSAGPQSRLLEGVTWDEASAMKEGGADVRVHACSKGIIQRDHQQQAVVINPYTAVNPFESVTDADIDKYKTDVENKSNNNNRSRSEEPRVTPAPPVVQVESPPSPVSSKPAVSAVSPIPKLDVDDTPRPVHVSHTEAAPQPRHEAPVQAVTVQRTQSAKYKSEPVDTPADTSEGQFSRSKSERYPQKLTSGPVSPTKSTSSAEATTTHDERSSREGSPAKEPGLSSEGRKSDKKKKKLFSFGKKDKKEKP